MATGLTKLLGLRTVGFRFASSTAKALTPVPATTVDLTSDEALGRTPESGSYDVAWLKANREECCGALPLVPEPMMPSGEVTIYEGPERDLVNFPRMQMPLYGGRTRMGFIPEEWFDFFYHKTGVSGPYVFLGGLITTLLSKEIWVVEHHFPAIPPLILILYIGMTKFGPKVAEEMDKGIDAEEEKLIQVQEGSIVALREAIDNEETAQWQAKGQSVLFEAKRENVRLQLEAEYRRRMMEVYKDVKKRLDYQVEVVSTRRRVEQRHMINWIVNNVVKSIDEKQEKQNIDNCIAKLKSLAAV